MTDDKRKVLDLLEFCSELCPSLRVCQLISNVIPTTVLAQRNNDIFYITDKELAGWLQEYADALLDAGRHNEDERNV